MRTLWKQTGPSARVEFSHDGAQVVVSAGTDRMVRFYDIRHGRQVCQLAGHAFALVEGLSGEHTTDRHVITTSGDTLRIYEIGNEEQPDGAAAVFVACFRTPGNILSVRCFGAAICVGCAGGVVCILSAPFLAA